MVGVVGVWFVFLFGSGWVVFCVFFFQAEDGIRDIGVTGVQTCALPISICSSSRSGPYAAGFASKACAPRSEEHTSELQSRQYLVCRLLLEKKKKNKKIIPQDENNNCKTITV